MGDARMCRSLNGATSRSVLNDYCTLVSFDYNRVRYRARLIAQGVGRGRQQDLECHHRLF